ncbi:YigZ family protein [Flavobacterium sp.]|uniref:IMPACT family protein n=1 Tax=Flavobacterium sp. TaxID=239 RepID=UPI00260AD096|nr:YigZ family protein [Flavobacterium sp.]
MKDTYRTIAASTIPVLFKEKQSKFLGYAFPVATEADVKMHLERLRKEHVGAVHFCYAYQLGAETIQYRANDDGEPSNSAGMPIYGQLLSFDLTNVLVVVVRYYGGIKLGVGGLIAAYRTTAQLALETARIEERTIDVQFKISFDYPMLNKVMRLVKEQQLSIIHQSHALQCELIVATRKKNVEKLQGALAAWHEILWELID